MNNDILDKIAFDSTGLVPAIAQQHDSGEVLMMAWMNADAVLATLVEGQVCYWSRSRGKLWRKGESSHTGRHNCFFTAIRDGETEIISEVEVPPEEMYGDKSKGS